VIANAALPAARTPTTAEIRQAAYLSCISALGGCRAN